MNVCWMHFTHNFKWLFLTLVIVSHTQYNANKPNSNRTHHQTIPLVSKLWSGQTPDTRAENLWTLPKMPSQTSGFWVPSLCWWCSDERKLRNWEIWLPAGKKGPFFGFMVLGLFFLPPYQGQASGGAGWDLNRKH